MSIESEILRIQHNVADTYAAVAGKGGTVPTQPNSANLAAAVASIPAGSGDTTYLLRAPVGTIVIWSGTADNIPTGWRLCDGQNGTPDLRDRFVLGAGETHPVGETGGSEEVTLTVAQMPRHSHSILDKTSTASGTATSVLLQGFSNNYNQNGIIGFSGNGEPHPNMPPYYTLCYIMKLTADPNDSVTVEEMNAAIETAITGAMEEAY